MSKQRAKQIYETGLKKLVSGLNRKDINERTIAFLLANEAEVLKEPGAPSEEIHAMR